MKKIMLKAMLFMRNPSKYLLDYLAAQGVIMPADVIVKGGGEKVEEPTEDSVSLLNAGTSNTPIAQQSVVSNTINSTQIPAVTNVQAQPVVSQNVQQPQVVPVQNTVMSQNVVPSVTNMAVNNSVGNEILDI